MLFRHGEKEQDKNIRKKRVRKYNDRQGVILSKKMNQSLTFKCER